MNRKPKLLLIDNDLEFGNQLVDLYKNRYEIYFVEDQDKAKNVFHQEGFDLVLLDLYLKGDKDGLSFIDFAKQAKKSIIIVTITNDTSLKTRFLTQNSLGVDQHLVKSESSFEEWAEVLDQLLENKFSTRPRIFLSHQSNDKPFSRLLKHNMERHGVKVWIDESDLRAGKRLSPTIHREIRNSDGFVVVITKKSVNSSYVNWEIEEAVEERIHRKSLKIIPILYKRTAIPELLRSYRYIDFTPMSKLLSQRRSSLFEDIFEVPNSPMLDFSDVLHVFDECFEDLLDSLFPPGSGDIAV